VHAFIIMYELHVVAVPAQRAWPPSPSLPSTPPSRTAAHEIVAPGDRQKPSPSQVKSFGQSCGPWHAETRQSSNAALYVQPATNAASTASFTTRRKS
jgi:hypothetical protein